MRLNLYTIYENMQEGFMLEKPKRFWKHEPSLESAILLNGPLIQENYIYVAEPDDLPGQWVSTDPVSMVIIGRIEENYFNKAPVDYFCVIDSDMPTVFNYILGIFRSYSSFDEKLSRNMLDNASPNDICEDIYHFMNIPYIVFDDSLRILFRSENTDPIMDWEKDSFSGLDLVSTEYYNQIMLVSEKNMSIRLGTTILIKDDRLTLNMITSKDSTGLLNVWFFDIDDIFSLSTLAIVDHTSRYILASFSHASFNPYREEQSLSALISSMLDGQKYSAKELEERLQKAGWSSEDTCCCLILTNQSHNQSFSYTNTLCLKIENLFSSCVSFPYKEYIVSIINMDKSGCPIRAISNRIGVILRDSLLKAGISFKYWSFDTTPIYYKQAIAAYEMGSLYSPTHWYYYFEDYALFYMLHYGASRIPPRHLCHPALVHLYRYDKKNGTELLKTLETYIKNGCNAIITANELYIHRNTFYQRLRKINELEDIHLDNYDNRLYLQMSTKLIQMYYYELEEEFHFPQE